MKLLLANLLLAIIWSVATGHFTGANFLAGFAIGYLTLRAARPRSAPYFARLGLALRFAGFYCRQIFLSSMRVARDAITPGLRIRPGIVGVPLEARTDFEITLLANLISLTPGTLSLEVSSDRSTLYVHNMYLGDADTFRHEIKDGLERRVLELLRPGKEADAC